MTKTSNSYLAMYDRMPCVTTVHGSWDVLEQSPTATFKKLTISNPALVFDIFATDPFLTHPNTFDQNVTTVLQNPNCDGMSLVEQDDGKLALVLAELKSKLSKNNLVDAYQQLVFSILKATHLLCLCDDFSLSKYAPIIIIACHGVASADKMDELKDFASKQYQEMKANGSCTFFGKCLPSLLISGTCTLPLGKLPFIDNLPIHKELKKCNVRVLLVTGPDSVASSTAVTLTL